jgi:hypothetical protein
VRARKALKRAVGAGLLAGLGYAAWRAWRARVPPPGRDVQWDTAPFPFPPVPRPGSGPAPERVHVPEAVEPGGGPETEALGEAHVEPWVAPLPGGACPASHPVKAKTSSGIFHVPGGANYDRTQADRCYADADAAAADGLRPAKR